MNCSKCNVIILMASLLIFFSSSAKAEWLQNGKPVSNSLYAKTDDAFGATLFFTDKPDELFEAWNKEGLTVKVSEVDNFKVNQSITALILFSNCTPDAKMSLPPKKLPLAISNPGW